MLDLFQKAWKPFFKLSLVLIVFVAAYELTRIVQEGGIVRDVVFDLGYSGVLLVSLVSGFNLLVPIPAVSFVPVFVEAGLNIWMVVFFIIVGTSIADSVAYAIGIIGRKFTKSWGRKKLFRQLDALRGKYYWAPVIFLFFFAAFVPLPNELVLVPLGFIGYKIRHVLISYVAGNIIFATFTSFGIIRIFNII